MPKPNRLHPAIVDHDRLHGRGAIKIPLIVVNHATLKVLKRIKEWLKRRR